MHNQLILFPRDPRYGSDDGAASVPALLRRFTECGLVDPATPETAKSIGVRLEAGSALTQWFTFLGCSPTLVRDGDTLIYMELPGIKSEPVFLAHDHPHPPRCPDCRTALSLQQAPIIDWQQDNAWQREIECPSCGTKQPLWRWDHRYRAGWTRICFIVHGIVEGTAVPADKLLVLLKEQTGTDWTYLYR